MARKRGTPKEPLLDPKVAAVKRDIEEAEHAYHDQWSRECDERWDDYHAEVAKDWAEDDWHTHIFPPHLIPVIEGMIAAQVEPEPHLLTTPRPRPMETIEEVQQRAKGAEVAEIAVNWALQNDDFRGKQRPFIHQDMVTGFTWGKFSWEERVKTVYSREFRDEPGYDDDGYETTVRTVETVEEEEKIRDDPTFRVGDNRDFFWPANCKDVALADWLADREYMSFQRIKELEEAGIYEQGTVAKLEETALPQQGRPGERTRYGEGGASGPLRTKDVVEVIERWTPSGFCTIGNRQVLMREGRNRFWHGDMPYITTTAIPNPFQVNGKSIVEVLAPIQRELWFLANQAMDNLKLLNNLIYLIRADAEDAHSFKWYPGAQWFTEDPEGDVKQLPIDPTVATISLQRESLLKGELQNIMGALPGTGSADSQTIDQKTATGISIITNIAQQVLATRKMAYQTAFSKVGQAFLALMQQFMVEARTVTLLGPGGARVFAEIDPKEFQGAYDVSWDIQGDSLVRQERRAEAQTLYQMLTQVAPLQAQFGTPFNLDAIATRVLKAFDVPNPQVFFLTKEQQAEKMQQAQGQATPPGGGPPSPEEAANGMVPPGMGPLGSTGNGVTAPPGPGVTTSSPTQQMLAGTGPQR